MSARQDRIRDLVAFLCSPTCLGRAPGTPGGEAARLRIIEELESAGVEPAGSQGWLQPVPGCGGANVLARVPGTGELGDRAILVAAHYDHLGAYHGDQAFWGADDNAAAVAILVELARQLSAPGASGRQVLLAFFDGEEPPYFLGDGMGSVHYVQHPPAPLEALDAMVCMDLVGHACGPADYPPHVRQALFVLGAELSAGLGALVDEVASQAQGVRPHRLGGDIIPALSDYHAFHQAGIPWLFLTCGRWEHYHEVTDTPEKLDYSKIESTADFLYDLTDRLRLRGEDYRFDPAARDDAATARSLLALARLLEPQLPIAAGQAVAVLTPLVEQAGQRSLRVEERQLLSFVVGQLEQALS